MTPLLILQMSPPPDVLDYIFSFLESDFVALKACSLSHPFLSQFAERYLYATIKLQDGGFVGPDAGLRVFEFNQLLLDTPRIGSCVRTVQVVILHKPQFDVTDLTHISSILQELSLVKKIALIQEGSRGDFSWQNLPEAFRQAFLKCLCLPSMVELSLEYVVDFPLSALKDCTTIKILKLRNWKHDPKSKVTRDALVHPLPPIESLSLNHCERKSLQKMLPWLEKRNIRSLSFSRGFSERDDFDVLSDLLARCSIHLTALDLDVRHRCILFSFNQMFAPKSYGTTVQTHYNLTTRVVTYGDLIPITLSPLLHLEKLTIRGIVYLYCTHLNEWIVSTSIPAISNLLKTSSSLKCLSLVYIVNSTNSPLSSASWLPLVRLFTESSISSFRLHIKTGKGVDVVKLLTSFADCAELMKLVDKGVLVITPTVFKH